MNELARVLSRVPCPPGVSINVAGQQANTLLHDGHAWKGFARSALAGVRRAERSDARYLVQASFAFVQRKPAQDPLRSLAETILECEAIALSGKVPACVVRLGYLYGPQSADLRAYRKAFKLGRPYWAGPSRALQHHVHFDDAARALVVAATQRNAGRVYYATGGRPVSFMDFMDHFARRVGRRYPLHVPRIAKPLMRLIIREEHMQQVAHAMPARAPAPRVPGWRPAFADCHSGVDQTIEAWTKPGRY